MNAYKYKRLHDHFQTFALPGQPFVSTEPAMYLHKPVEVAKRTATKQTQQTLPKYRINVRHTIDVLRFCPECYMRALYTNSGNDNAIYSENVRSANTKKWDTEFIRYCAYRLCFVVCCAAPGL